jgi:ribosomal protein S12
MSKPDTVTQCRLRVRDASEMVSFIDSDAAVLGKRITIDDFPGIIWEVVFVGDTISRQALQKQESYHRTHRKGTDI